MKTDLSFKMDWPPAALWTEEVERPVIEAIQRGDAHAMTEFIGRHARWVRGVLFSAMGRPGDLDDVAQRVWMTVWREAPRLQDASRWRAWVYRIARNAAFDAGRSRHRQDALLDRAGPAKRSATTGTTPDEQMSARERHEAVLQAIAELPALYREPFVLRHMEDLSYRQIGERLGLPADTVETRLVRARRLLRAKLAGRV